jgi:hypothetical protein
MAHEMQSPTGAKAGYGAYDTPPGVRDGRGWRTFAAVMLFAAGATNALWGIAALVNDDYFTVDELLFGDLSMWGVLYLVFAAVQVITGFLILGRSAFGAVLGIGIALLSGILALISIGAYPVWSIVVLVIDGLIIYGLTVYGFAED